MNSKPKRSLVQGLNRKGLALFRRVVPKLLRVIGKGKITVLSGPFKGMQYQDKSVGSVLLPKIFGTYEKELVPFFLDIAKTSSKGRCINIGAGEGYYAVGVLYAGLADESLAYESEEKAHAVLYELAKKNGLSEKLKVFGSCNEETLLTEISSRPPSLVIVDIEGGEVSVLSEKVITALRDSYLLVEIHDVEDPKAAEILLKRLDATHSVVVVWQEPRVVTDLPISGLLRRSLPTRYLQELMNEYRPYRMRWLVASSKSKKEPSERCLAK